ncbi:RluA family pseudouridine synthase [Compostibacter hankyongensis]|uniref:Pseudouridine synthase n=1 Tax=Compostibacter hankyongensis TaxID=1007089 RepID=A0ABP8GA12_9BACT
MNDVNKKQETASVKPPEILYENDDFIAVNKPAGLLTLPDRFDAGLPSLAGLLEKRLGKIFIVHRLDRDTSGLILFAKHEQSHQYFSQLFASRQVEKYYYALVNGQMPEEKGRIDAPLGEHPVRKGKMTVQKKGKSAVTLYEVSERFALYNWLTVQILTGRTHQIRVHMQSCGHPVVMDELYGTAHPVFLSAIKRRYHSGKNQEEERPLLSRLALHAYRLHFPLPSGEHFSLEAPLPRDLQATLTQLRKHGS